MTGKFQAEPNDHANSMNHLLECLVQKSFRIGNRNKAVKNKWSNTKIHQAKRNVMLKVWKNIK